MSDNLTSRQFTADQIARIFGIPAWLITNQQQPGSWYRPLWPWRIGQAIQRRTFLARRRITETFDVARHGLPARYQDW